jgi:hypothetical protein
MSTSSLRRAQTLVACAILLSLIALRSAEAQIVASGSTLAVTTPNAVASFTGPDLTGFVNVLTGETYLKNPSDGTLAGINSYSSSGAWTIANWTIGTEPGTGVPLATITAQDNVRTLTMTVKIDATRQEIVVRMGATVASAGMRQAWWTLAGLDLNAGRFIVPANSGVVFDKSHPLDTFIQYPNNWHAQMAVYETAQGSLLVYSTDAQMLFKDLRASTRGDSTIDVNLATQAIAPFGSATTVPTVEWRLKAFSGTWRVAAQVYRDWLVTNRPPVSNANHPWVSNIRSVVTLRTLDPAILPLLAAQVVPAQTLLYLVDWRVTAFDVNYPDYTPRTGVAAFAASARALGFKVMLHLDILGVAPTNPDYATVQAWHVRGPENLELYGWNWNQPSALGRYAFINLAAPVYRSLFINRVRTAVNAIAPDALHLDISGPMFNDGNGLIGGMSYAQGSVQLHQELKAAFPTVALGGEGENDIIYRYHSFAQSWWLTTVNVGHPIATFLFSPQVQYYGHLGQPTARESGFKNYAAELSMRAMLPTWNVTLASDLDMVNTDNLRLKTWIQRWQTDGFQPAWTADWSGALIRYTGAGGTTAALTDTGTVMTLTAAGSPLFTLAHDANQVPSPPYVSNWLAFDGTATFGLDPSRRYFLDLASPPASTHLTSLSAGVRIGSGSMTSASFAHIEVAPSPRFDFEKGLLAADLGVRFAGADHPLGNGAVAQVQTITAGGQTRSGIFIHPPYLAQVGGEAFVEYALPVPVGGSLEYTVAVADNAACTDGVTFKVMAAGTLLWQEHVTRTGWQQRSISLAAYGGTTVPLRLVSHPGPANNPGCDWALWNQVSVTAPASTISVPIALAPGSVFSAFTGNGSLALNGSAGTISGLPVPGQFTVFTQPGPAVASGTNLASVPFSVWNGAHDDPALPGSVSFAGSVSAQTVGGVISNPAIFASPPTFGRSVLTWVVRLPATPLRLWWRAGILDGATSSDGVQFQVAVNGVTRWDRTTIANRWMPGNVDLAPWAGQSVLIELITDSVGFADFDHAVWGDLTLVSSVFTDNPLTAGLTTIRRAHVTELRERVNAVRVKAGLAVYNWAESLNIGVTPVRAQHITELRAALAQAYSALTLASPVYSGPAPGAGVPIRAVHIAELRTAVTAIE